MAVRGTPDAAPMEEGGLVERGASRGGPSTPAGHGVSGRQGRTRRRRVRRRPLRPTPTITDPLEAEHIVPLALGGEAVALDNLRALHKSYDSRRGAQLGHELRARRGGLPKAAPA